MKDTTTKLRLLLANMVADVGTMRDVIAGEVLEENDATYLLREVDQLQSTAHRIIAFLDEDMLGRPRH